VASEAVLHSHIEGQFLRHANVPLKESTINLETLYKDIEKQKAGPKEFDETATFAELANEYGFDSEQHPVTTPDGYIL